MKIRTLALGVAVVLAGSYAGAIWVNLAGEGITELKGAPAAYKSDDGSIAWQGLTGTVRFAKDMSSYGAEMTAPGVLLTGKDGGTASLDALSMKMNQTGKPLSAAGPAPQ
jgi:Bacterial protein of unknown function (DUF945)